MMHKYARACGNISSGTFSRRSSGPASGKPSASTAAEKNIPRNSVAANSRRSFSVSRAPKYSLISTDAPMHSPETPRMMMFITGLAVPTAARAPVPAKRPTTMESTAL